MSIIQFNNVKFSYDGKTLALNDLTISIDKSEFVCVLGGNGSGKSTFAKHINALLLPDEGSIRVLDACTSDQKLTYLIRSNVGMVFQNPDDQLVASKVEDEVAFGPENLGIPSEDLQERVKKALAQVGLTGFEDALTHELSGGQKQRVAIAGVLAMDPKILILDEASAMLDPQGRSELMKLCHKLHGHGFTIVMVTHFMEEAVQGTRVVVLDRGKVALDGTPDEVFANADKLKELELDLPFPVQMCQALNREGIAVAPTLFAEALVKQLKPLVGDRVSSADAFKVQRGCENSPAETRLQKPDASSAEFALQRKEALLRFENVSFSYAPVKPAHAKARAECTDEARVETMWGNAPEDPWAIEGLTFELARGGFLAIAGHTGSGKSTLIQLASGLLHPTRGTVQFRDADLSEKRNATGVRRSIGVVFQYPERQLFAATVADDVAFGPRNLGFSASEVDRRVKDALERVHLNYDAIKDRSPFSLSGGQQRRVAVAGVIAMEPEILILDEPAAGLDPRSHDNLLALVKEFHQEQEVSVIMVSHNMDDVAALADRVLVLDRGRAVLQGTPLEVFRDEAYLKRIGLGIPQTYSLAADLGLAGKFGRIPSAGELAASIAALVFKAKRECDQCEH